LLAGGFDSLAKHFDGFLEPGSAGFFFLCFGDPAAILLAVGIAERVEEGSHAVFLHQADESGGHFDGAFSFVLPDRDFDSVAELLAGLLADGFEDAEHVLLSAAPHKGARVGDAVKGRFDGHPVFRAKFLFDVVREDDESSAARAGFDLCGELIFPHGEYSA
jgi:hypothetical protein